MRLKQIALISASACIASPCLAANLSWYGTAKSESIVAVKLHVAGIADGLSWANSAVQLNGGSRLYCPPDNLSLNDDNYINMIDSEIARSPSFDGNTYLGLVLLRALQRAFPCQ